VSAERAARLLDWRPTTTFHDGVRQYVEWYRANRVDGQPDRQAGQAGVKGSPAGRPRRPALPAAPSEDATARKPSRQDGAPATPSARRSGLAASPVER
jgi:UDP-glucose 4-epimerase